MKCEETDKEKRDLKPCPFCGDSYVYFGVIPHQDSYSEYRVTCEKCHACCVSYFSEEDVIYKWNRRA